MKNKLIKFFRSLFTSHQSPARHASQLAGVEGRLITNHYSQSGFAFIAIILIMLVIFSISIVSGADDFAFSPDPTGKPTPTTSPTATPSAGTITPTPTPTPDPSTGWSITYVINSCENGIAKGKVTATGPANGYMTLELQDSSGSYVTKSSEAFLSPDGPGPSDLTLNSSAGYNTRPWRLNLFEGGSGTRDNYSGGILRNTIQGAPTSCP